MDSNQTEKNETSVNQTGEEKTYCGDFICQSDEKWYTCELDCEKPSEVKEANALILEAEKQIEEGEDG